MPQRSVQSQLVNSQVARFTSWSTEYDITSSSALTAFVNQSSCSSISFFGRISPWLNQQNEATNVGMQSLTYFYSNTSGSQLRRNITFQVLSGTDFNNVTILINVSEASTLYGALTQTKNYSENYSGYGEKRIFIGAQYCANNLTLTTYIMREEASETFEHTRWM